MHILIAVRGQVAWPFSADYRTPARWVVHVRDMVDVLALVGTGDSAEAKTFSQIGGPGDDPVD